MPYFNNDDEKPKNDFEKPKFAPYTPGDIQRERGGCLTLFLVFVIGMNVFFMFSFCMAASQASRYASGSTLVYGVAFAIQAAVVACAVAVWNWKTWGYYGLAAVYVIQILIMLFSGNMLGVLSSVVGLVILVSVVNSRLEMFE